jgi:hypothetical protein
MFSESNQLKFNLNAIVDNLNLVNLTHQPKPILIEKNYSNNKNKFYGRINNEKRFHFENNFELIDQEKLSMYSFLIQRDLKNKEYLKNQNDFEPTVNKENNKVHQKISIQENNSKSSTNNGNKASVVISSSSVNKKIPQNISKSTVAVNKIQKQIKPSQDLNDIKKCSDDTIKSIENLLKQLNQCNKINF